MKTADLIDRHASHLTLVHLPFRKFGTKPFIKAPIQTIKCFEDNSVVRSVLETPGEGRALVIDGGGSTRIALLGDMLAQLSIDNGWAGIVISGAIRDSLEVDRMDQCIFALGTSPVKSAKEGWGKVGCELSIGGAVLTPGQWVYGDADGVLSSENECN